MSSFINKAMGKVEAALDKNSNKNNNSQSASYGNTQTQDQYGTTGGTSGFTSSDNYGSGTNTSSYNNPASANAGPHSSGLANKTDPRVDSDRDGRSDPTSRYGGVGNTQTYGDNIGQTSGPGGFGTSDTGYGDSARTNTAGYSGTSTGNTGFGTQDLSSSTGQTGNVGGYTGGSNTYDDMRSSNAGPHGSNVGNKLDPRVDSDLDNRGNPTSRVGGYGGQTDTYNTTSGGYGGQTDTYNTTSGGYGSTTTGDTGYGSTTGNTGYSGGTNTYDDSRSSNAGPHGSNLMNKMDPRIDSDVDNRGNPTSRVGGYGSQTDSAESYGTTGGYGIGSGTGSSGYSSGGARVHEATTIDQGVHGTHGSHGAHGTQDTYGDSSFTPGSGNAQKTAGPHNSDMLNKLDPRVDSDLDGSKTYGGNRTQY